MNTPGPPPTDGPVRRVIRSLGDGCATRTAVSQQTGLDAQTVDAILDHLVRSGRISATRLGGACPDTGCGACPSGRADASPGCTPTEAHSGRGPVALTLAPKARG
ncbi:MAG: hypothetical protein IPL45_05710 [Actinomycetales bacterium]|nr:hypothetical protein [Actinomycetales bacterium]